MPEVFANDVLGTVTSGGTTAPAAGTSESWTVNFTVAAPAVSAAAGTWFYLADNAPASELEKVQVTSCPGGTGSLSLTVTRGADGTTPATHVTGFTVQQVFTRATLLALQGGAAAADIARVFGAGHSYMAGFGNAENAERYLTRLCSGLGAEEVCYAVSGAVLAQDSSGSQAGGYANVLNALTPRVASGSTYTVRHAAPYLPLSPVVVFDYGVNDLAWLTATTATNVAWCKMALTAITCIARAGGWFPDTDSSVAYGSGWTANTGQSAVGWPTSHSRTTTTGTVTITVPADFPGGEVDLLTLAKAGASGGGTKWSTVVDGGAAQVLDGTSSAFGSNNGRLNLVVQRLTGLAAGTHTIVMTVSALDSTATAVFQGWLIASPSPPAVVLVNQPAISGLPLAVTGAPHTPITSTDVTALNTAITAVAALFTDGSVVVADRAAAFAAVSGNVATGSPGSLYLSDGLHFNTNGHGLTAQVIESAIRSAALPSPARFGPGGIVMRQFNGPLEPALSSGWSIVVQTWSSGWFGKDRDGNTVTRATLVKSSAGVLGETIATYPPGYQPAVQDIVPGFSWASGYASVSNTGLLAAEPSGALQWFAGDPTTELDAYLSWYADGQGS